MDFEQVGRTHVGCRRKVNEDAMLCGPAAAHGLWAVADGLGGHSAGDVASARLIEVLAACPPGEVEARLHSAQDALQHVNTELLGLAASDAAQKKVCSTVVALVAGDDRFGCLWVGDSRGYLLRGGELSQLTHDHSLVQMLVDTGELDAEAAATHPNANVVTRAVGSAADLRIDCVRGEVRTDDVFLLASDGLTRLVSNEELRRALQAPDLDATADELIATCLARGAPDNVTFVILRRRNPG